MNTSVKVILCCALLALRPLSGLTETINFNATNWPDTNWEVRVRTTPLVTITNIQNQTWLQMGRTDANNGSAQLVYTGGDSNAASAVNQLGDITGRVVLATSNNDTSYGFGLALRAENRTWLSEFAPEYYLAIVTSSNTNLPYRGLALTWAVSYNFFSALTNPPPVLLAASPASIAFETLRASAGNNKKYLLEFSVIGYQFNAALWKLDTNDQKNTLMAELSYYDDREELRRKNGWFALRAGRMGGSSQAYFREASLEVLPETPHGTIISIK